MPTPLLWIIIAILAAIAEVLGSGLVFIGVAAAAVVVSIVAALFPALTLVGEAIVFVGMSVAYLIGLRPSVLHLMSGQRHGLLTSRSGSSNIVGKRAVVTHTVSADGGQIRIGQGEFWSARPFDENDVFPEGTRVQVLLLEGLTALVASVPAAAIEGTAQSSS
jgi:membrane protein implicated in regulation of membrane protease activity